MAAEIKLHGVLPDWSIPEAGDELKVTVTVVNGRVHGAELRYRPATWASWSAPIYLAHLYTEVSHDEP